MPMNLQLQLQHSGDMGGPLGGERLDEDSLEAERARALTFGTKAVAVSSNKALTSKFRGVCWCVPALHFPCTLMWMDGKPTHTAWTALCTVCERLMVAGWAHHHGILRLQPCLRTSVTHLRLRRACICLPQEAAKICAYVNRAME